MEKYKTTFLKPIKTTIALDSAYRRARIEAMKNFKREERECKEKFRNDAITRRRL